MSNWTYVSGSIGIEKTPYSVKLNKDGSIKYYKSGKYKGWAQKFLPYLEEQFKITKTEPMIREDEETGKPRAGFRHRVEVSSFPIIRRDIEEMLKDFPQGESSNIYYMLKEENFCRSSSSDFNSPETENFFKEKVMEKFPLWENCSWEDYDKYIPTELDSEDSKEGAVLCIHDSIRWCEAKILYKTFIDFLTKLVEKGYFLDFGHFTFIDMYKIEYNIKIDSSDIVVTITNKETSETQSEFFQIFCYKDINTEKRIFPIKQTLRKVDKLIDSYDLILEDYFPDEKEVKE